MPRTAKPPPTVPFSADFLRSLPESERAALIATLDARELQALQYEWDFWARPCVRQADGRYRGQLPPPGDWSVWVFQAGRGSGKTRSGVEWVRRKVEKDGVRRINIVGATSSDVRKTIIEGESGLLEVSPPWFKPKFEPSKTRVVWPNGAIGNLFSAEEPERLRGPQCEAAYCDEVGSWKDNADQTWSNLRLGLRLGRHPQACITTTNKARGAASKLLKQIKVRPSTVLTGGTTYDNRANLADSFFNDIIIDYEGTRLGKQELLGEDLDDAPGALWTTALLDSTRVARVPPGVDLIRIVVGLDPAGNIGDMARFAAGLPLQSDNDGDDAGIWTAGLGSDGHLYFLADDTASGSPAEWGRAAVAAFRRHHADRVVGEGNHGGDNVEGVVRAVDPNIPFEKVHASRGKAIRAEPVAARFEQGKAHMVGEWPATEDELVNWEPGMASPNRLDALVIAASALCGDTGSVEVEPDPYAGHRW